MLRAEGYEVVKACDGLAGWDLVGRTGESFDLVVTESRMPGMSGTEFIHRLREHNPTLPSSIFRAATSTPSTTSRVMSAFCSSRSTCQILSPPSDSCSLPEGAQQLMTGKVRL